MMDALGRLTFQVKSVTKTGVVIGAVRQLGKKPRRDDYFVPNGDEVEWGGGYQQLGHFDDARMQHDERIFRLQCFPNGKLFERKLKLPKDVKVKPGQFILVEHKGDFNFEFFRDRPYGAEKPHIKPYKDNIND